MLETRDHGDIREIRIAHPPANALNPELTSTLTEAIRAAGNSAGAIVLSGAPGMFSAGLDVPALLQLGRAELGAFWESFFALNQAVAASPIPIAAAITGHAPAGGAILALLADYRVMIEGQFRMGLNEVRVGIIVPHAAQYAMIRVIGRHAASKLLNSGAMLLSEEARALGLVDELAPDAERTVAKAMDWCERQLALPRNAMLATRTIGRSDLVEEIGELSNWGSQAIVDTWFSEETQAALRQMVAGIRKS